VAAGASTAVALVAAQIISRIVDRPRPFVADPGSVHLFAKHVADASFPSDHATAAFAIATAILLRDRRWGIPVIVLAAILAVGRVAMAVHYPSDVLGGAVLGALVAVLLWTPWPRQRLDGLADLLGAVFDSIGRKLFGALRPKPA
jgi:undecaprenyl-diphosphatase